MLEHVGNPHIDVVAGTGRPESYRFILRAVIQDATGSISNSRLPLLRRIAPVSYKLQLALLIQEGFLYLGEAMRLIMSAMNMVQVPVRAGKDNTTESRKMVKSSRAKLRSLSNCSGPWTTPLSDRSVSGERFRKKTFQLQQEPLHLEKVDSGGIPVKAWKAPCPWHR